MDAHQTYASAGTKPIAPDASLPDSCSSKRSKQRPSGPEANPSHIQWFKDLWELTKPEISLLVTLSALGGFLLGSPTGMDVSLLVHTLLGTALTSAGSGVLNHFRERKIDSTMRRTTNRPLPAGRVSAAAALRFGAALLTLGLAQILWFVNPLTAGLALLTSVLYLLVYTPLKQVTTYNTLVGCFPGALPALGGWVAATGSFGLGGWLLFGILFTWQMPHFLSLAWMYRQDYARGNLMMLPVVDPEGNSTAYQTLLFTGLLVALSLLPTFFDLTGWLYFFGSLLLGIYFLQPAVRFVQTRTNQEAKRVLNASIIYVPVLVALIFVDRFII